VTITSADFARVRALLGQQAEADIAWAEECCTPKDETQFALEAIFVICNSGMKNTVARRIFDRCLSALHKGQPVGEVFGHYGKAAAIDHIWRHQGVLFVEFLLADDKLGYLESLPWIGAITKFHLAKNFGLPYAKPDVHLQRLANREGTTPQDLCERLAGETGLCVNAIDTVLWRACANGVINSRTGEIAG
jgi:hypothetical protein